MTVVVEGEHSRALPVESGVPQGTVLGPLLLLCHVNDMPDAVKSTIRLFADDCLLYRVIRNIKDHVILQQDLHNLENCVKAHGECASMPKSAIMYSVLNQSNLTSTC